MKIGMFDSGIGGLTVLKQFLKKYPNNEYIYVGDNKNIPYGSKSKSEIIEISRNVVKFLKSKDVDLIIIACGTVSANAIDILKEENDIPIIGVIDETINYLNKSSYNKIGVMATKLSIESHKFLNEVKAKKIIEIPCYNLAYIIESGDYTNLNEELDNYLAPIKNNRVDVLVLGCTHYPLVKDNIELLLDYKMNMLDMGEVLCKNITLTDSNYDLKIYFGVINDKINQSIIEILGNKIKYSIEKF